MLGHVSTGLLEVMFAPADDGTAAPWSATDRRALLAEARISERDAGGPWLPLAAATRLWRTVSAASAAPAYALEVAQRDVFGSFGAVEYLARHAGNLGDALATLERYSRLTHDANLCALERIGGATAFHQRLGAQESEGSDEGSEHFLATIVHAARRLSGVRIAPLAVEFTHPCASDPAHYESFFAAPVRFGAPETKILFDRQSLEHAFERADFRLRRTLEGLAAKELSTLPPLQPFSARTRAAIDTTLGSSAATSLNAIAACLGLSARTLQRGLAEEGASFARIKTEAVMSAAVTMLKQGDLSVAQIAASLEFDSTSSFIRAFKRRHGVPPGRLRVRG